MSSVSAPSLSHKQVNDPGLEDPDSYIQKDPYFIGVAFGEEERKAVVTNSEKLKTFFEGINFSLESYANSEDWTTIALKVTGIFEESLAVGDLIEATDENQVDHLQEVLKNLQIPFSVTVQARKQNSESAGQALEPSLEVRLFYQIFYIRMGGKKQNKVVHLAEETSYRVKRVVHETLQQAINGFDISSRL